MLRKGITPLISTVIIVLISAVTVTLVMTVAVPTINRAKETAVLNEAGINMRMIDNAIRTVASEGVGSFRTIQLKVSDGDYRISNYSGNYSGSVEYTIEAKYNTLPLLSIVKEGNIKYSTGVNVKGLVGYWKFDEGSGCMANDNSTYGNNGQLGNSTCGSGDNYEPGWIDGKYGKALSFDGSNDYVSIGNSSNSLDMGGKSLSISVWINSSASYTSEKIIFEHSIWPALGTYQLTTSNSTTLDFDFPTMGDNEGTLEYNVAWNSGNWHNVVATFDNQNDIVKMYYDGVLVTSQSVIESIGSDTNTSYIGSRRGNTLFFNGTIDEAKVWNRVLTPDEIKSDYGPKRTDYRAVLEYNKTYIEGIDRFGKGSHKFCIEKTGTYLNRPLIEISECG